MSSIIFYENELYQIDNMRPYDTKENLNDLSVRLNVNLKMHMGFKIRMI